jgi:hypothetical protein
MRSVELTDEQIDAALPIQWACVRNDPVWTRQQIHEAVRALMVTVAQPAHGVSPTSHPTFCRDTPAKEG